MKLIRFALFLICIHNFFQAQSCSDLNIKLTSEIKSSCNALPMTMLHDQLDRPYLYIANKEGGLKIYNISNIEKPYIVDSIKTTTFESLDVMNLHQDGNFLYLALGNSFSSNQKSGMAIIDITSPENISLLDYYIVPNSTSGGGVIKTEGNYAYLGAMQNRLQILDISDKKDIKFISQFLPSISFPPVANPDKAKYNARGMDVKNGIVYLCYDAGGIRIINCTDKLHPRQTGKWCNPAMYTPLDHPKAYNNVVLRDSLLYVTVDYCGVEVINIKDTHNIKLQSWWNPYHCPNNNWFTSPSHTNELVIDTLAKRLFMSTGKSDMIVLDISNPNQLDSCNYFGGASNNIGTWGINRYKNQVYLSYICTFGIPFVSNWSGVKIVTYQENTNLLDEVNSAPFTIFPNPSDGKINVTFDPTKENTITVFSLLGERIHEERYHQESIDLRFLRNGIYLLEFNQENIRKSVKLIIEH